MSGKKIAKIVLGLPILQSFDYSIPLSLRSKIAVGCRVKVIFNRRNMTGYVYALANKSPIKNLSPIISLLDETTLISKPYLSFLSKVANYYCASVGEMIEAALPLALRQGNALDFNQTKPLHSKAQSARNSQKKSKFRPYVYCAAEETKKREFFLKNIEEALKNKTQVIFLLPDTSLVFSWHNRLKEIFSSARILALHSRLGKKEALLAWLAIRNQEADIVVGSRQAILSPMLNIGLIIVDYEDNFVYKQETRPYYHARDIAIILAKQARANLILSSISPSIECFYESEKNKFKLIMDEGEEKGAEPLVKIVDLKTQGAFKRGNIFSIFLFERIRKALEQKKKVLVFLNRKGFATYVRCRHCGHVIRCQRCSTGLVYYYRKKDLHCPYCNYHVSEIEKCPECGLTLVYFGGFGVEKIESEAYRLFPAAKSLFLESGAEIKDINSSDLVITTQAGLKEDLIKGNIDLCIVVSIDNMLNFAQLRSSEEAFRVLRRLQNLTKEEMIIQTFYPEHPVFKNLIKGGYLSFAREELADRKSLRLPPFRHLISVNLRGPEEEKLNKCARDLFVNLSEKINKSGIGEVFEPIKDMPYMLRSKFRLQILIKTAKVESMNTLINKTLSQLKARYGLLITVNVDI